MRGKPSLAIVISVGLASMGLPLCLTAHEPHTCPPGLSDEPALAGHVEQADILKGRFSFDQLMEAGKRLFLTSFNVCDGQSRRASTGTGEKRIPDQPAFSRTSGPDAGSCVACHVQPRIGGSGDFVANVFVLAQAADPVAASIDSTVGNERNTLGMFGAGAIEMLAREMSAELGAQVRDLPDGTHILMTKGVQFEVTVTGGKVVASKGVDTDLVIKPFHQAGVVVSLREFTVNAFNQHHGMQAEERFDLNLTKGANPDHDEDGVRRELTVGDITAATLFQAALGVPGRVLPDDPKARSTVQRGEVLFEAIGCTFCHVPIMKLNSRFFVEPNPNNSSGNFHDSGQSYSFDLTRQGEYPRLEPTADGGALVRAYTDLKRHNLCDPEDMPNAIRHFCNEKLPQNRPDQDGRPGQEFFITRKLWDLGSSNPFGHRGDLTTCAEAILAHGGEARASRDRFVALLPEEQAAVVAFLKTLQIVPQLPPGAAVNGAANCTQHTSTAMAD
jgi:hypothetical protein